MRIAEEAEKILTYFEKNTEGILGSSVILSNQALVIAESSSTFKRSLVEGMSSKILTLANETLKSLLNSSYNLRAITIQEENHYIYVKPISEKYYVVVITNIEETTGLREMNVNELTNQLKNILP